VTTAPERCTICVPILNRPERIRTVLARFNTPRTPVLFLPDPTDEASVGELDDLGATYAIAPPAPAWGTPTYASKINHAFRTTATPFILYASDDVRPQAGWWDAAERVLADARVGLLGTNDLAHGLVRAGRLATHGVVRREYVLEYGSASLPDSGPVFHEGYRHWCVDAEASAVARARGRYRFEPSIILRHDRGARDDSTYRLGRSFADRDRALLQKRWPWWPSAPYREEVLPSVQPFGGHGHQLRAASGGESSHAPAARAARPHADRGVEPVQ
jgi:hypothetical protein